MSGQSVKPRLEHYYDGSELVLVGVDKTNPFVYDNDIFTDTVDFYFDAAMSRLNHGTMKGIVVTCNILEPQVGFQRQMDDARRAVDLCRTSNMGSIPDPVFGASGKLVRPADGDLESTPYCRSDGSDTIVRAAHEFGSVERPLIVFVGGQPTTVASAYLQDTTIADKVIVCHIDPLGYNGADSWATYLCAKRMRYFAWGNPDVWWWKGTYENQVILDPPILPDAGFDALPENPLCRYLKTTYRYAWPNNVYHDLGDGAIGIYLQDRTHFSAVKWRTARYQDGCLFSDAERGGGDVLAVSAMTDENKRNQGSVFFDIMGNKFVYAGDAQWT